MKEAINVVTNRLYLDIQRLDAHYKNTPQQRCLFLGDVGELYTETCVELGMVRLGIPNSPKKTPSYILEKERGRGVDYMLNLIDRCGCNHNIPIEVKNLGLYRLPENVIKDKIYEKYKDYRKKQLKILSMNNKGRVKGEHLECGCIEKNITILEMNGQIDEKTSRHRLKRQVEITTNDFVGIMKPYLNCKGKKTIDKIRKDIRDGRQIWYIATKYNTKKYYVRSIKTNMKKKGEDIPEVKERRLRNRKTGKFIST